MSKAACVLALVLATAAAADAGLPNPPAAPGAAVTPTAPTSPAIKVSGAWIRWLPAGLPGAGYMTLANLGSRQYTISGASSADYGEVSIHRTLPKGGMSVMEPVAAVVLAPQQSVQFAEGGLHLMLMQPKRALRPGDRVVVSLQLSDGQTLDVKFDVRAGNAP